MSYSGIVTDRGVTNNRDIANLSGTIQLLVDYSNRTLSGTITLTGVVEGRTNTTVDSGTITLSQRQALASLATLSGRASPTENGAPGRFLGLLNGPNAEELGLTFAVEITRTLNALALNFRIVGSAAAKR